MTGRCRGWLFAAICVTLVAACGGAAGQVGEREVVDEQTSAFWSPMSAWMCEQVVGADVAGADEPVSRGDGAADTAIPDDSGSAALADAADGTGDSLLADEGAVVRPVTEEELRHALVTAPLVYLGERHGVPGIHDAQAALLEWLAAHGELLIGVEMLPWTMADEAAAWSAGELSAERFVDVVSWSESWGSDWSLYEPAFAVALHDGVSLVPLNAPREVSRAVYRDGWDGVSEEVARLLPEQMDDGDIRYRRYVTAALAHHPHAPDDDEERAAMEQRFFEAQLVWDETMAERTAGALSEAPEARMVVLVGAMHVAGGHGIPQRVTRRGGPDGVRVILETEATAGTRAMLPIGTGDFVCRVGDVTNAE